MANDQTSNVVYLSNVRLSFPHLVEPQKRINEKTGKERISYNGDFLVAPSDPGLSQFMAQVGKLAMEKWKDKTKDVFEMIQADRKSRCYGAGEEKKNKKTFEPYDGYAGMTYISASSDTPPQMIQADGKPVDRVNTMAYQALARRLYGGCRVNVALRPWLQDNNDHGFGVRCDLVAIQFLADDTAFGEGKVDASGMFGAVQSATTAATATPAFAGIPPFITG